jgi:hypothetical protein
LPTQTQYPETRSKRAATRSNAPISKAKRRKLASKGTKSQPVLVDDTQPTLPPSSPPLPPEALGSDSQAIDFESQLRKQLPKDKIAAPVEASEVATVATTEAAEDDDNGGFYEEEEQDYSGVDWARIPWLQLPPRTALRKISWIYQHGYRLVSRADLSRVWFVCHLCHKRKAVGSQQGIVDTTLATSSAAYHLKARHHIGKKGLLALPQLAGGQRTIQILANAGVRVSQHVANEMGG